MNLTHFQTMALFAFIISLSFAFLSRGRLGARIKYTVWAFLGFILIAVAIGWIMYPASH
jgi:multidrug transporter EmrE-like cation transporter